MHSRILYISYEDEHSEQVEDLLLSQGIETVMVKPPCATSQQFALFSEMLSSSRLVALSDGRVVDVEQAKNSDLWVQFGMNCGFMPQSHLSPEEVADRILQEIHDHSSIPE